MNKKIIDIINKINEESAKIDYLNENISGYNYMVNNWESYDVCNSKEEFIALLNILQANGETLESLNDCYQNDDRMFMGIFSKWDSRREIAETTKDFNEFYTPADFIAYLITQERDGDYEDYDDYIKYFEEVAAGENGDHQIYKTRDGYVRRVWY